MVRNGQKKIVTGIVINEKPNVSVDYCRKLKQELYFCRKYGIAEHMAKIEINVSEEQYLKQRLGKVNYVVQVSSNSSEIIQYKE